MPHWVETQKLVRRKEFLVVCKQEYNEKIKNWGNEECEDFCQLDVTGLNSELQIFYGKNANNSCPDINILKLSSSLRLHLEDGIKAGEGNEYFKFAPPKIVLENGDGSEHVTLNNNSIEARDRQNSEFLLPESTPCNIPLRIEVQSGDHKYSRVIRLKDYKMPDSFDDTPPRNSKGEIDSDGPGAKACGTHVYGEEENNQYSGPDLKSLNKKLVFIGEKPGHIIYWPEEPYPSEWEPLWAAAKVRRKKWKLFFCGPSEKLKRISQLPDSIGDSSPVKSWKEAIWIRRKRYILPEIEEVRKIWKDYVRLAQNV